jgi:hypothetical protein
MATLLDAVRNDVLEKYEVPDWDKRNPVRQVFTAPALWDWIDNEPRAHVATAKRGGRSPFEHLEQMLSDYCCEPRALRYGDLKQIIPTGDGVWRIHPPGLRVFGWIAANQTFVAVSAAMKSDLVSKTETYDQHRRTVLSFAIANGLEHTILRGDYLAIFSSNH